MEIMELSQRMETLGIVKPEIFCIPLKKDLCSSPQPGRITRSQRENKKEMIIPEYIRSPRIIKAPRDPQAELEKFYLNKKVKFVHKNLETIYEDPVCKRGNTLFLGSAKVRRSIYLGREFRTTTKQKSKLRKTKIKRLGKQVKRLKMTDDEFKQKMLSIESFINDDESNNRQEIDTIYKTEDAEELPLSE